MLRKRQAYSSLWATPCFLLAWMFSAPVAWAQTSAFTYQGTLNDAGTPANGNYDLQFKLFDALSIGAQQGATVTLEDIAVTNGLFTVQLDFGAAAFPGAARWLEISVRPGASTGAFTWLVPRQPITTVPYTVRSLTAANALQFAGSSPSSFVQFDGSGNVGIGTTSPVTRLDVRGKLALDPGAGNPVVLYTAASGAEQNRYLELINAPTFPSASGLKAGGILVADNYNYAQPGKNDLVVKGSVGIGTAATTNKLSVEAASGVGVVSSSSGANGISIFGANNSGGLAGRFDGNVSIFGKLSVSSLGAAGSTSLCRNSSNEIATCSSSLRYKTEVQPFNAGMELVRRLRPVSFKWKSDSAADLGLIAEEVAAIEPLLVTHNQQGEIEGVKYAHLNVVLINALREQQTQITQLQQQLAQQQQRNVHQHEQLKQQQSQFEALKQLVCRDHAQAGICQ